MIFLVQLKELFQKMMFCELESANNKGGKLIIALDDMTVDEAIKTVNTISEECSEYMDRIVFKVHTLIDEENYDALEDVFVEKSISVFLDKKYHDIGNTLNGYLEKLSESKMVSSVEYLTIHASNGVQAIDGVMTKKKDLGLNTKILAVTALTSLSDDDTQKVYGENARNTVLKLAKEALEGGADGIVCSSHEAEILRAVYGDIHNFEIITPGVRFEGGNKGDQQRVTTPEQAVENGADHIVMGRDILKNEYSMKENVNSYFLEIDGVEQNIDQTKYTFEKKMYNLDWKKLDSVFVKSLLGLHKRYKEVTGKTKQ